MVSRNHKWYIVGFFAIICGGFLRDSAGTLSSSKFSLNSCRQSSKSCNSSPCNSSSFSILFVFSVSAGSCNRFHRNSALILPLLSIAGFSVLITVSCDEDVEEVGVDDVEELVDKPGTTNGT